MCRVCWEGSSNDRLQETAQGMFAPFAWCGGVMADVAACCWHCRKLGKSCKHSLPGVLGWQQLWSPASDTCRKLRKACLHPLPGVVGAACC
jgi:hypothetical protein